MIAFQRRIPNTSLKIEVMNFPSRLRRIVALWYSLLLFTTSTAMAQTALPYGLPKSSGKNSHPDRVVVESLIQSGLYDLAMQTVESHVKSSSNSSTGISNEQAQWRLLRAEVQAAKLVADLNSYWDRPALMEPKLEAMETPLLEFQSDPRKVWFQFSSIWCRWYVLRSCVAAYLAAPARSELQKWTLSQIRESIDKADQLIDAIKQIPTNDLPQLKPDGLDALQISSLQAESYLLKCDLLALRATLYPAASDERIAAGTQMVSTMDEAEKRASRDWSGRSQLQLARCRAQLFLGLPSEALKGIAGLVNSGKEGASVLVPAAVIAAEAHRMKGELAKSNEWIERAGGWQSHPGLAIESFSNLLATHQSDPAQVAKALAVKKEIGKSFGAYWESRADALLVSSNRRVGPESDPTTNMSLELLKSEVKQLIAAKKWQEAIDKLNQAEMATANQNANREALRLAMQSAALWGIQKSFDTAASEFHRASLAYQDEPQAPDCAVNAVTMLQEHLKVLQERSATDATLQEPLAQSIALRSQILRDIVMIWPASSQADTSAHVLESLLISEDRLWGAFDLWLERCEKLTQRKATAKLKESMTRAMEWFAFFATVQSTSWLEKDLLGDKVEENLDAREKRLGNLIYAEAGLQERFLALVSMRQHLGWKDMPLVSLPHGPNSQPNDWLRVWLECEWLYQRALVNWSRTNNEKEVLQSAVVRWNETIQDMKRDNLGVHTRRYVERRTELYKLSILLLDGQTEEVKQSINDREQSAPRDPWWSFHGARLMQTQPTLLPFSLERYRRLANGLPPGQDAWLDCRARTVEALLSAGKKEDAKKLIDVVIATYPSMSQTWTQRFQVTRE
jgi:hypothetical protein